MITVTVSSGTGKINVPAHVVATITSDIPIKNIEWLCNKPVNFSVSTDQKTVNFTPSADGEYVFTATVWDTSGARQSSSGKISVGTVPTPVPPPQPTPTPTPIPTPTGTLWDSNINGKWNDGVKRTLTTKEGGQKPDDKSIFCAASGSPKLVIDGDGVAHLVAGSGGVDNVSIRLRSRHNGECNNQTLSPAQRFGGHGWSVQKDGRVEFKTEDYHNVHSNAHSFSSGISIGETWHHVHQTCKGNTTTFTLDNKSIGSVSVSNHGDDSLLPKNSYIWLRLNNSGGHGRIYIMAINVDSALDFDFKMEQSTNSIAFKNVKLVSI